MGLVETRYTHGLGQGSEFDLLMKNIWEQPHLSPESQLRRDILTEMDARTRTQIDIPFLLIPYGSTLKGYAQRTSDIDSAIALQTGATQEEYQHVANTLYSNFRTLYDEQDFYPMRWDNHWALQAFHLITDRTHFKQTYTKKHFPMDDNACYTLLLRCGGLAFLPAIGEMHKPEIAKLATQIRGNYLQQLTGFLEELTIDPETFWDTTMRRMLEYTGIYQEANLHYPPYHLMTLISSDGGDPSTQALIQQPQ